MTFPDGERAVDLGLFSSCYGPDLATEWCLMLVPYLRIHEARNVLRPRAQGYVVRVVIGSDDGRARRYDVRVNWNPKMRLVENEWNANELLASIECEATRAR